MLQVEAARGRSSSFGVAYARMCYLKQHWQRVLFLTK